MALGDVDLCFTARALAQSHPMSEVAAKYRQECFEGERERQPISELADWASTGLLVGYCLRRAEEVELDSDRAPRPASGLAIDGAEVGRIAEALRSGDAATVTLLPPADIVQSLDQLITTELDKRSEHLREQLSPADWAELEQYITWWVVHGYCVRASEIET